jgi:outer membrane receptor protein involved in Fe transport
MISVKPHAFSALQHLRTLLLSVTGLALMMAVPANAEESVDKIGVTGPRTTDILSEIPNSTTVIRGSVPPNGGDATLQRADFAVNAVVELSDDLKATFGLDYYDEDGVSDGFVEFFPGFVIPAGFEFDRNVLGAFGELHYKIDSGPTLLASVRRDDPNKESGETFDSSIPTDDLFLDSYNRLDVTATLKYSDKLNLLLSVDNLLDENYEEAIGFPSPGIRARLGLRYQF